MRLAVGNIGILVSRSNQEWVQFLTFAWSKSTNNNTVTVDKLGRINMFNYKLTLVKRVIS